MISVNKVILLGYIGSDPDIKYMQNGNSMLKISVATKYYFKEKKTDKFIDKTDWHKVILYNKFSDLSSFLKKGCRVYIEGSLRNNKWQDKDGKINYSNDIIASVCQIIDFKKKSLEEKKIDDTESKSNVFFEEDIPF